MWDLAVGTMFPSASASPWRMQKTHRLRLSIQGAFSLQGIACISFDTYGCMQAEQKDNAGDVCGQGQIMMHAPDGRAGVFQLC